MLTLFNCKMIMAGSVDFSAANARSTAQLRVKGDTTITDVLQCCQLSDIVAVF